MKKKIVIFLIVLIAVGGVAFSSLLSNKATEEASATWSLSEKKIKQIFISSSFQTVYLNIEQTENEKTTVQLSGNVSKATKKKITSISERKDELLLDFRKKGLTVMAAKDEENPLKITIFLGKDVRFKKVVLETFLGDAVVKIPKAFNGLFETEIEGDGMIKNIPETTKEINDRIVIKCFEGDIRIDRKNV